MRIQIILLTALFTVAITKRPNIVFFLTDDQDVALGGMTPLRLTKRHCSKKGITFVNAFSTTPICCPSRSSILTGLYLHSHGTVNNSLSGGCSDRKWQSRFEGRTFAAILHETGYRTFYAGKYLNKYGSNGSGGVKHVPKGWDWWVGLVGNSVYYDYTLSVNGSGVYKGHRDSDYLTDVLRDYSLTFLREKRSQEKPFLMVIAPPAPHEPFTPANRHKGRFKGFKAPRTPNFNRSGKKDKHWLLRLPPDSLTPEAVDRIDEAFRNRWESLLSVDELVDAIVSELRKIQVLDRTYIIFSSDHGFHLGQFGQPWDKRQPYETDIRIPLLFRGPGFVKSTSPSPVLNVDFAATILDIAGANTGKFGDGKSFLPAVKPPQRGFLVEYRGEKEDWKNECYADPNVKLCHLQTDCKCFDARNNTFDCVRRVGGGVDDLYCEFRDGESFREFYDVRSDPHQMRNLAGSPRENVVKRILDCCKNMMRSKKAVDECFEL